MLHEDIKGLLKVTPRDLRKFGLTVGGVFCLLGTLFFLRHKPWWPWFVWPGGALMGVGAAFPRGLNWIYFAWMMLAMLMGAVVSMILLTLLFFFVVTPIGWIARLMGKDFLSRKLEPKATSYWISRDTSTPRPPHELERQF